LLFSASTMYIMTIFYEMMMETCYFKGINGEHWSIISPNW